MKRLVRLCARVARSRAGSAAVEFSFIAPILILMAAGVFELARALQSKSAVSKVASQYALAWADCADLPAGTCRTEMALYNASFSISNLAPQLKNTVTLQMFQVKMSGTTPQVTYSYPTSAAMSTTQKARAQALLADGQTGVVVTVSYNYTVDVFPGVLGGVIPQTVPMSITVAQLKA